MKTLYIFLIILLLPNTLIHAIDSRKEKNIEKKTDLPLKESKQFYVLTIPKAGTFLLVKLLAMLTEKRQRIVWDGFFKTPNIWAFASQEDPDFLIPMEDIDEFFLSCLESNRFPLAHFNFAENFQSHSLQHPEYAKIILIRDLRDVCVSTVFYLSEEIENVINSSSFDDKLMFVIKGENLYQKEGDLNQKSFGAFWKIDKLANIAIKWMKDPSVTVCRFEDLVGEKGGGSIESQREQIVKIANTLNISLTSKELNKLTSQLFGVRKGPDISGTYRDGKIGSWQEYFKDEHKEAFHHLLGPVQTKLGYPSF